MKPLSHDATPEERRRALLGGDPELAGAMTLAERRAIDPILDSKTRMDRLLADPDWVDKAMDEIAGGANLSDLARANNVRYEVFYRKLKGRYADRYADAKAAHAEMQVYKNLETADAVEDGSVEPSAAKVSAGIRQWFAERAANETWGQRSTTNLNVKGVIGLHMDAVKQFVDQPLVVEDAEFEEVEEDETETAVDHSHHPLL